MPDVIAAADDLEPSTWVDFPYTGTENGSFDRPFNTLDEGMLATPPNGLMRAKVGVSPTPRTIDQPIRIIAWGGLVRIGAP